MKKAILAVALCLVAGGVVLFLSRWNTQGGSTSPGASKSETRQTVKATEPPEDSSTVDEYDWIARKHGTAPEPPRVELLQIAGGAYYRSGSLLVVDFSDYFEIKWGKQTNLLAFKSLPVTDRDCEGYPLSCNKRLHVFAFDEPRNRVLLDISTGSGNAPKIIVGYDLKEKTVTRYGKDYAIIIENAAFSKTGRYFAYEAGWASGECAFSTQPSVVDTEKKTIAHLPFLKFSALLDVTQAGHARWVGDDVLEYEVFAFSREDCRKHPEGGYAGKVATVRINTGNMEFESEAAQ